MRMSRIGAILLAAVLACACGSGSGGRAAATATAATTPGDGAAPTASATGTATASAASSNWTRFGYDAAKSGVAPRGIAPGRVAGLRSRQVALPGTVDSSPIYVTGVHGRNLVVMTTTYGITFALDASSGATVWRFTPSSYRSLAGSSQITTATPLYSGGFVYASSPDGKIHKLSVANGHQAGGRWPVSVTTDAGHEKIASSLNLTGNHLLVTTGGYIGDAPPYQGKVLAIDRRSGRITSVFNSLCSGRRRIIRPSSCGASASAIWGRAGAVVAPGSHHVFVATSNGPFNGRQNWGDSTLELSAGAGRLLRHYTPRDQATLEAQDIDLGSTSPALLPDPRTGKVHFALQGGKDGKLRLLALSGSLHGVRGTAGRRLGGERQVVSAPGGTDVFTAIAVVHRRGLTDAIVTTGAGTAAWRLSGGRLHRMWANGTPGTSPVVAGSVLWVMDINGGLVAYRPRSGAVIHRFGTPSGHWNSPIVAGGRVYLPTGNSNSHSTRGSLTILG
jgi:outer membrane protein assembly factor BamB